MAKTTLENPTIAVPQDDKPAAGLSLTESYEYCKRLAKRSAGNFYYSFLTLPRKQFREMCSLYGFMRMCDDLADDPAVSVADKAVKLQSWRDDLTRACEGDCSGHPVLPSLRDVCRRRAIPTEYLHAVIDGVESDLQPQGFESFEELNRYCYQVAGAVGLCCVHVWGLSDDRATSLAIDCGTAFQLTNILRDLGEDAALGRVYLPREELDHFEYSFDDILANRRDERFRRLMQFQVQRAKMYFDRSQELFALLKPPGRAVYSAMRKIYGGILSEIERRDYDVYTKRISLSRWRKMRHTVGSLVVHRLLRQ